MTDADAYRPLLERIADALERLSPPPVRATDFNSADAFIWQADTHGFEPMPEVSRVPLKLLKGIDRTAGVLWIAKFYVLDRILFKVTHEHPEGPTPFL